MQVAGIGSKVRFHILGALEVWAGGEAVPLGGFLPSCVLAMLLLEQGRIVPVHRLVAAVWDEDPPQTALQQVRKAISILRHRIPGGGQLIVTASGGYRILLDEDQLDATLFSIRLRRSQEAEAEDLPENAVAELRAGLDLWRGRVLAGLGGAVLTSAALSLGEKRYQAAERCFELRLRLGETSSLIGEIRETIDEEPLRELLRRQLMLALYRSGRQAEALEEFVALRKLLADELGIAPDPRLVALHREILQQKGELEAPPQVLPLVSSPLGAEPAARPSTLPYHVPDFVGREAELGHLDELGRAAAAGGTRIVAIDGMGGVGKTELALYAAHRMAEQFEDGQLYLDMRGHSPHGEPLEPRTALELLLGAMGVPGDRIPAGEADRVALWRTATAGKRILLVLDDTRYAVQIRPLLPGSANCLVLVTGRRAVELAGASWVSLGPLPTSAATDLIVGVLGRDRARAEPDALVELVELCGCLPLALRIAAARLCRRPQWSVRHLARLLHDERRRLRELRWGEHSVADTLALSYDALGVEHRTALRALVGHPARTLSRDRVVPLLGTDPERVEEILEQLVDAQLLQQSAAGCYSLHGLVRSFVQGLVAEEAA